MSTATQGKTELSEYYRRKVAEGKPKMSVINAVANKILARAYACLRDDRLYVKKVIKDEVNEVTTQKVKVGQPMPQKLAPKIAKPTFDKTQRVANKVPLRAT